MYDRTDLQYLQDILESIDAAIEFVSGYEIDTFSSDRKTRSATIRELEIIEEAANKISKTIKEAYPAVPWRLMKDLRNVLSHEYFGVNSEVVWDLVQHKLPVLKNQIDLIITTRKQSVDNN
ncbi:HepT-like ribonuclease domain-containing protein [Pelotalea chapellei]|uniref:DUF86 domain-containing protein n=1 Tax=Pelotalea chapellei TaxID=44671 RepID=A0ABS5U7W2_9BACT|nr:DUF86 domain-containing protein [Pelotalea chapellei]MBT1071757.1 DUF86 domain-containing protein [Pelotalea chapellei]